MTNLGSSDQPVTWTPKVKRVDGALGVGQTASDLNPFRRKVSCSEGILGSLIRRSSDSGGFSAAVGDAWLTRIRDIVLPGI